MPEPSKMDLEAKLYFQSLPPALQEQLMQSAADLNTKEDLVRYCTNLLGGHAPKVQSCPPKEEEGPSMEKGRTPRMRERPSFFLSF